MGGRGILAALFHNFVRLGMLFPYLIYVETTHLLNFDPALSHSSKVQEESVFSCSED